MKSAKFCFVTFFSDDFSNLFSIDRTTGQITINELSKDRFTKDLVVEASDGFLTAVGKVQVQFTGVNTPPLFTKCTDYDRDSSVLEGDLPDTRLFTVRHFLNMFTYTHCVQHTAQLIIACKYP